MAYKLLKTDKFIDELSEIVFYIKDAFSLEDALKYVSNLEEQLLNLSQYPYIGQVPRYQPIAKQGYRVLVVKQNLIFYKINEEKKEIILHIIVSSKKNYLNLI